MPISGWCSWEPTRRDTRRRFARSRRRWRKRREPPALHRRDDFLLGAVRQALRLLWPAQHPFDEVEPLLQLRELPGQVGPVPRLVVLKGPEPAVDQVLDLPEPPRDRLQPEQPGLVDAARPAAEPERAEEPARAPGDEGQEPTGVVQWIDAPEQGGSQVAVVDPDRHID